jgi:hypothetical protein
MATTFSWDNTSNAWTSNHWGRGGAPLYPGDTGSTVADVVVIDCATPPTNGPAGALTIGEYLCRGNNYGQSGETANLTITTLLELGTLGGSDAPFWDGNASAVVGATLNGSASNEAYIGDGCTMNGSANNYGAIGNNCTINGSAINNTGAIGNNCTMNGSSSNTGTIGDGCTMNGSAVNDSGTIGDGCTMNDTAGNYGTIGDGCTMNDSAINNGAIGDGCTMNDTATNYGTIGDGCTLNDSARNIGGVIGNNFVSNSTGQINYNGHFGTTAPLPAEADVRSGTVYGQDQTGTLAASGGGGFNNQPMEIG